MTYPGGKGHIYKFLINQIPPHQCFISGFLGHCAVMRHKRPARVNIGIDLSLECIEFFQGTDHTELIHGDVFDVLPSLPQVRYHNTFVYFDPPYLKYTRLQQRDVYRYELGSLEEHQRLLEMAVSLKCMVMISGYDSGLYRDMLRYWRVKTTKNTTRGGTVVDEYVWMNYPEPKALHDYSCLGQNYRERELIREQQKRWKRRLLKMPVLQRKAMLMYLQRCASAP